MGLRNRKGGDADVAAAAPAAGEEGFNDEAQDLMKDHLELMKEVIMRIREDEEFAKNIYADCPRLQNLLDRNPDLRPIFEDPNLVRINFEQVYKDAGGILPEDEKKRAKCLTWFVNSPIFKVIRLLLMVKKVMGCIAGGGIGMITGCFVGACCCGEDALPEDFDPEDDDAGADGENDQNKQALNSAAEYMENPEVQEQMEKLMEDPENLEEAIENDAELKALRDSNPLCAELMSDPETMKILTDPENLRALGDAPDLIEADFSDPNWSAPDIDMDVDIDGDMDGDMDMDGSFDADADGDGDADADGGDEGGDGEDGEGEDGEDGDDEEDEDEALWEEAELEQQDGGANGRSTATSQARAQQKPNQAKGSAPAGGGVAGSLGACARDLAAGAIVGSVFGGAADLFMGGDDFGGADNLDIIDNDGLNQAADAADMVGDTDFADTLEEGMDGGQDAVDNHPSSATRGGAAGAAGGAAAGGAAGAAMDGNGNKKKEGEEGAEDPEGEAKKGGMWKGVKGMTSAVMTAAKEQVAATILGDDLAEMLVEKMEEKNEDESEKSDDEDDDEDIKKDDPEDEEGEGKKKGFFGRKK